MLKLLGPAAALTFAFTSSVQADEAATLYRVFVGDHEKAEVTAFDLSNPERRWSFATAGQAKLYPVAGGAVVAAVQSEADHVQFISSGVELTAHGDHADIKISEPAAIEGALTGPRPFHLVTHGGETFVNYDQGGYAEILDEAALKQGKIAPVVFRQNRAHHGFVAPLGDAVLSTVASEAPTEEGAPPPPRLGLRAFDASGEPKGELAVCTAIHGEAFSGAYLAAGCREGVLTAKADKQGVAYAMLAYPAELPSGATTGTLLGSTGIQVFLGNSGADALVVVDPADEPHFRRIDLPFRRVDFVLDPVRPADAYVLTEDGTLHRVNLLQAEITGSARATTAYSMEGHWNDPRPRLAMAGDEILMTDPQAGLLRRFSAATLAETGAVELGGKPYNLAVAGGSGLNH